MEFISAAALMLIIFSLSCYYFFLLPRTSKISSSSAKSPPVAGGARPFIGHLHLFNDPTKLPHMHLASLADKHGPIFTVRLGIRRLLMVNNWEIAKELFTTHDAAVSSRPIITAAYHLGYNLAMFGWTPYGTYWRDMRKLVSLHLLSGRRLEMLSDIPSSEATRYVRELYRKWKLKEGRLSVDMSQWFGDLNLNVIMRMVAGKRFYDDGSEAEEGRRTREVMREFFYLSGLIIPADVFPFLRRFDIGGLEKKMAANAKELDRIVGVWLEEHKVKKSNDLDQQQQQQDFMDVMLEQLRSDTKLSGLDIDTTIKANCVSLISGGTDTTSLILVWTLAHLVNDPRILKKAQEELDTVVGRDRRVQESDINNLVYLQAICKEAFRLHPAGHLGGPRAFTEDATILGKYHVPKGTWLMVNLWKLHRDPKVWGSDALEFKPERFLEGDNKDLDVLGTDYELLPFGAGRRICPGSQLGVHILKIVMANLLQAFDLWRESSDDDDGVDMTETAGMTNAKATPLQVLVAPRLAPHLY